MKRLIRNCASALLLSLAAASGWAQAFPSRAITIYCAFPAGAGADTALRALAQAASRELGQPVIVDNRPGVGGTLGASALMSARNDGYTLAQVTNTLMRQPFIGKTNYDPHKDFSYVISPTAFEMGLAVRADAPWKTLDDLIAFAQKNPDKVTYATSGVGTIQHQVMQSIGEAKGAKWVHAPYKGTAPALNDLQGGHIAAVSDTSGWAPFVDAGKFRLLAVYGPERLKRWPNVPTLKELGHDIAENVPWGIIGPTGVDPAIVKTLHDAFRKAMNDPAFIDTLALLGQEPRYMGAADYQRYMRGRIDLERKVVDKYNLRLQ